ncbi:hypothetical protein SprV_0502040700 [Sparganum proliferum]
MLPRIVQHRAAPGVQRPQWQGNARQQEQPQRVAERTAGLARTLRIDQGVGGDHRRGQQWQAQLAATRTQCHAQDAGAHQHHAQPRGSWQWFAQQGAGQRNQDRRAATHQRIGQAHVDLLVTACDQPVIGHLQQHRSSQPRPAVRGGEWQEGQGGGGQQRGAAGDQHGTEEFVWSALDDRIPAGVQGRSREDQQENGKRHRAMMPCRENGNAGHCPAFPIPHR